MGPPCTDRPVGNRTPFGSDLKYQESAVHSHKRLRVIETLPPPFKAVFDFVCAAARACAVSCGCGLESGRHVLRGLKY